MITRCLILTLIMSGFSVPAFGQGLKCLSSAKASKMFKSGDLEKYPNYTEGPGSRVQKQYPDTFMFGQTKYLGENEQGFGLCNYYNHVGWVVIYGSPHVKKTNSQIDCDTFDCATKSSWRSEYTESKPEQDVEGQEMIEVCIHKKSGIEFPSLGCGFISAEKP